MGSSGSEFQVNLGVACSSSSMCVGESAGCAEENWRSVLLAEAATVPAKRGVDGFGGEKSTVCAVSTSLRASDGVKLRLGQRLSTGLSRMQRS